METGEDEVLVVDCRGNMQTGCLGGMLMTALATNGAAGLVVDGCVRDLPEAGKSLRCIVTVHAPYEGEYAALRPTPPGEEPAA